MGLVLSVRYNTIVHTISGYQAFFCLLFVGEAGMALFDYLR